MTAPTTWEWLRTAADRISIGSHRIISRSLGRVIRGVSGRFGRWPWWVQLGLAYVALLRGPAVLAGIGDRAHERVASGAWSGALTVSTVLWVIAAYRVGGHEEPQDTEPSEPVEEQPEPGPAPSPSGPAPVSPVALVAAVRDIGTPHAQLKPLAEHLGTTTDAVRAAAGAVGWPVKDVRMEGRSSSAGLRWDDCPSPTILLPSSSVVGAGQSADNDNDDTEEGLPGEGLRVEDIGQGGRVIRDPADTVRHHSLKDPRAS
ncbi:hypothetical protein [Streptomyces aureus]|uniref:hypothetical protein n=1 Tax=Streptomyces aureus TaxID=193461 RepID=UPI000568E89D|nr:hypothetical protein [Streptomyces aureus]